MRTIWQNIGQKFVQKNKQKMGIKLGEKLCKNQAKDLGLKMCKNWTIKLSKKFYQKIVRKNWQKLGKKLFHACFRVISGNTVKRAAAVSRNNNKANGDRPASREVVVHRLASLPATLGLFPTQSDFCKNGYI